MKVTLVDSVETAQNIRTFHFKPEQPVSYTAGQYIELTIPHDNPDERGIKHWFTLSASPTEEFLAITTKFAERSSTFKTTLKALPVGTVLEMAPPEGDFTLPEDQSTKLLFVAGGIGVTPFHSMIQFLKDRGEKRDITLMYGLRDGAEMAFKDLFDEYGVNLIPLVGEPITADKIMKESTGRLVYVSGPEPMVEALNDSLLAAGLPKDKLKTDYFPNYTNDYSN